MSRLLTALTDRRIKSSARLVLGLSECLLQTNWAINNSTVHWYMKTVVCFYSRVSPSDSHTLCRRGLCIRETLVHVCIQSCHYSAVRASHTDGIVSLTDCSSEVNDTHSVRITETWLNTWLWCFSVEQLFVIECIRIQLIDFTVWM